MLNNVPTGINPFPTGVGMNRIAKQRQYPANTVPHRRGDEPRAGILWQQAVARSPQAWG